MKTLMDSFYNNFGHFQAVLLDSSASFESSLKSSKIYTGTVDILKGSMNIMLALTILITVIMALIYGIGWLTADQHEKPAKRKALITTIIIGIVVACVPTIILIVAKIYGAKGTENVPTNAFYPLFMYLR